MRNSTIAFKEIHNGYNIIQLPLIFEIFEIILVTGNSRFMTVRFLFLINYFQKLLTSKPRAVVTYGQ